jgi:flagellar protein FliS
MSMFGSSQRGANAYAKVGLETGVVAASPHQLVVMLFEGAIVAVKSALAHMQAREIERKGKAISKAITIIEDGMRASLDKNGGGDIAANLDSLYQYMAQRLVQANLTNDASMLEEVLALLNDLKSAWDSIGGTPAGAAVRTAPTINA